MLDSMPPARRRVVLGSVGVLAAAVVAVLALVVVRATSSPAAVDQTTPGPVVVVPGYGGATAVLEPVLETLGADGRVVELLEPSGENRGDLDAQAERLGDLVDRTMERTGASSVDVVGYSAGGVVARLWVRDHGGDERARRVLTVGSPHHGTSVAALAVEAVGCSRACEQLQPDSDLLRRLNAGDETPAGPAWATVRSSSDRVVTPDDSAALDGALDLLVQDLCPDARTSHRGLPSDPVVQATLRSVLGRGAPSEPSGVDC